MVNKIKMSFTLSVIEKKTQFMILDVSAEQQVQRWRFKAVGHIR